MLVRLGKYIAGRLMMDVSVIEEGQARLWD